MKENFRGFDKKPAKSAKINILKVEKSVREHEILFALRKIFRENIYICKRNIPLKICIKHTVHQACLIGA